MPKPQTLNPALSPEPTRSSKQGGKRFGHPAISGSNLRPLGLEGLGLLGFSQGLLKKRLSFRTVGATLKSGCRCATGDGW